MTKSWKQAVLMTVLFIMVAKPGSLVHGTKKQSSLTIVGPIIAYEISVTRLAQLTFVPNTEVVIVRVDKLIKGREQARYLKVIYTYGTDERALTKEMFDGKKRWRFTLKRDHNCDSSVEEMRSVKPQTKEEATLPGLKFTSETEVLADDISLPCYQLQPGDYRAEK